MPNCPECREEIDYLVNETTETQEYHFYIDSKGLPQYDLVEMEGAGDRGNSPFMCPLCGTLLFDNEQDAIKFFFGICQKSVISWFGSPQRSSSP